MRYLIVGIDPGNTVGIAVLGLDGGKIALQSTSAGIEQAIEEIELLGTPSIVATDVYPAPANVLRVASSFNAKLFVPRENVREDMKREIAKNANVSNAHERDAYCAAVIAYRAHANKLRQIGALPDFSSEEKERLMHLAISGYTLKNAVLSLATQKRIDETQKTSDEQGQVVRVVQGHSFDSKLSQKLQYEVASLSRENAHLKKLVQTLEHEKQALGMQVKRLANGAYAKMLQEREVRNLRYQVKVLGEILQRMRAGKRKKDAPKREEKHDLPHSQSKGIKKLQENGGGEGQEADIEALINEYRKSRQTQVEGE